MSRVRRLLLGYLFPALLLHGEFGDGWVSGDGSGPPIAPTTTSGVAPGRWVQCAHLPFPAGGCTEPLPPAASTVDFAAAVFFLEGCEPLPDTFYLSHP